MPDLTTADLAEGRRLLEEAPLVGLPRWHFWLTDVMEDWEADHGRKAKAGMIEGPDYIPDPEATYWKPHEAALVCWLRNHALALLDAAERLLGFRTCDGCGHTYALAPETLNGPLTADQVETMLWTLQASLPKETLRFYVRSLATDWERLHALHALSPAEQQRVAEIRERAKQGGARPDDVSWLLGLLGRIAPAEPVQPSA